MLLNTLYLPISALFMPPLLPEMFFSQYLLEVYLSLKA